MLRKTLRRKGGEGEGGGESCGACINTGHTWRMATTGTTGTEGRMGSKEGKEEEEESRVVSVDTGHTMEDGF